MSMSRFDRHRPSYDYDYTTTTSAWDTRSFITTTGAAADDDDDVPASYRARPAAAAASVIGYNELDFHPRTRRASTRESRTRTRTRDRDRERDRDRDRTPHDGRDPAGRVRVRHSHYPSSTSTFKPPPPSLKPSLSESAGLDRENRSLQQALKQRLRLPGPQHGYHHTPPPSMISTGGGGGGGLYPVPMSMSRPFSAAAATHARARSLSAGGRHGYASSGDDDSSEENLDLEVDAHRDEWGVLPAAPAAPPERTERERGAAGAGRYYRHERLSWSSPRLGMMGGISISPPRVGGGGGDVPGWSAMGMGMSMDTGAGRRVSSSSREGSLERLAGGLELGGDRERYERGYSVVVPEAVGVRHVVPPLATQQGHGEEQLRVRFGGGLPGPRVPSAGAGAGAKRRSESYDAVGRKGLSPGVGGRAASKHRGGVRPQYNQVHALILTWAFHDLRTEDYTAPPAADYVSLEQETARLRATLERYGYTVHEFLIPMARSAEALKAKLKNFCRYAADDTLLVVYYHGHGAMDADNELVFSSHDHPENAEWSKAAAADLYAALLSGDVCSTHGRRDKYQDLLKKYERYRPVSTLKWADTLRTPLLSTPCDVLLILDCCAAGGAGLSHINWQPPAGAAGYTKHLFAACGFESSTSDDMTASMCAVLDEWVPPSSSVSRSRSKSRSKSADGDVAGGGGAGGVVGGGAGGPVGGGQFLTTKRLHQLMEDRLQKRAVGSQPIFKQLLPQDPEQYITLPNLRRRERDGEGKGDRRGRRDYIVA